VGQHERRVVGFPVIDEINMYYEIAAARPLSIEVAPGGVHMTEKALDDAGLQYTCRRVEDHGGTVQKCVITVPPAIPAKVSFHADYVTGLVTVPLVNVDRFDRVSLEFHSQAIEEPVLDAPVLGDVSWGDWVAEPGENPADCLREDTVNGIPVVTDLVNDVTEGDAVPTSDVVPTGDLRTLSEDVDDPAATGPVVVSVTYNGIAKTL
jgi:hypothetical protein